MSDVETIQRERGWRRCPDGCMYWVLVTDHLVKHHESIPNPLADTPDGWYEFGQILRWAHEKGWMWTAEPYIGGNHQVDVFGDDGPIGYGYGDFRTSIIGALAAAVSEAKG